MIIGAIGKVQQLDNVFDEYQSVMGLGDVNLDCQGLGGWEGNQPCKALLLHVNFLLVDRLGNIYR